MSKHPNVSEESAAIQHREAMETRPQDRYAGRGKFAWHCRECRSKDRMRGTDRETLKTLSREAIDAFAPWYEEPGNNLVVYYPCLYCNFDGKHIPDGWELLDVEDVLAWLNDDPLAIEDSRDNAGI